MDKSWMRIGNRASDEYIKGVDAFLDFAFGQPDIGDQVRCPCNKCRNTAFRGRVEIRYHLFNNGIRVNYQSWVLHGENYNEAPNPDRGDENRDEVEANITIEDDIVGMVHDACVYMNMNAQDDMMNNNHAGEALPSLQEPNLEASKFYKLLNDVDMKLYTGSDQSKLDFIVKLLHLKCENSWSNASMDSLLKIFKEFLPNDALVPESFYEAKKLIRDLGLEYNKIDACPNDCLLYYRENAYAQECSICGLSRWKSDRGSRKKISQKILHHFPLKSRLQRFYMTRSTAKNMRWHKEKRVDDGILRHPADSIAWKSFDEQHTSFAIDPRNVRLGLSSDGFTPFGNMSSPYSIWPVVLVPYNLPPWMCMKHPNFMLSLLIPGPTCPEMNIDVYLQPLIEELKELWEEGVETYDAYAQENFKLHAAVLWTINDFPAYGMLSGWVTRGKLACPCCNKDTSFRSIRNKICYMGHRRFLPSNHPWRRNKTSFDGSIDNRQAPQTLSGADVLEQMSFMKDVQFGKGKKRKRGDEDYVYNWRKKSIFFQLPYWKTLMLRHNLDVMHIERNVSDNILSTLMNMNGKTKDTIKSRFDLVDMGIRQNLHPYLHGDKYFMPAASYVLSPQDKLIFCNFLKSLKVPDGFSSNISRYVNINEKKMSGLKCHDHHILLQWFIPLATRGLLSKEVFEPLCELSNFFKNLCSKSLRIDDLDHLEQQIPKILCKLETIFPPAFFTIMMHLPIHLVHEAKIAGPVQYRWMYPFERYFRIRKKGVHNMARPEGSIAQSYLLDECFNFIARYLHSIPTRFNRVQRNDDGGVVHNELSIFVKNGCPKGAFKSHYLNDEEFNQVCMYVLQNCEEVWPFIEEHKNELERENLRNSIERHNKEFLKWFHARVLELHREGQASEQLFNLAIGPMKMAHLYGTYIVNGFRFHTKVLARDRKTQNSGVLVRGDNLSPSKEYYGVLEDIYELSYVGNNKIYLFKCHWWDVSRLGRGYKVDKYGYISVNTNCTLHSNEPFVLASQAEQIFYVQDLTESNWFIVLKTKPRDLFDMPPGNGNGNLLDAEDNDKDDEEEEADAYQQVETSFPFQSTDAMENNDIMVNLSRDNVAPESVDANVDIGTSRIENYLDDIDNYEYSSSGYTSDE